MKQVTEWLEKLGLSEYAQRFADNAIDLSVLPDLTDQDLEKIGVLLGHRRKILKAIAALDSGPAVRNDAAKATDSSATPPAPALAIDTAGATGERRYLTVMFCDLVGSTAISAQLDAEEWRDLVSAYLDAASAAVGEMGGHVAKKLGDGLMCLFGYPLAHENDAERAARAALSIQRALAELNRKNAGRTKPELVARIGLESGPAVLDASGEIYGDVANVAARVQALAEPGTVLITARVQRQVAGLFVAEERGTHALKGVPESTTLFRLVRASGGGRRSGQRNLTPLVGRDEEIATLTRRWERVRQGDGQLVLIVGEPGLGKSRLIEEFHLRLKETPHTWTEWTCSQLLQNTPLHPVAEWGRQRFGGADVSAERRLSDLESTLAQVKLDPLENASLLAPLLDIPLPKDRVSTLAPEELRRRQLAALTNWVMTGAKVQPVVLAFEDLHWADPTTLDVLRGVAERGSLAPLYIVATARPEFRPPWGMRSHHGTISLAPLDRAQVRDMVGELSARHALARDVVDDVAARTGGVPLFVEEVTRLLLERGEQGGAQAIPPTLQQSLMARLDRLGSAREVAQIGSVIGRGFSYKLLKAVAAMDDAPLEAALEKLSDADIVLVEGVLPESDYRFKHALIQDAAYENLLKSRRQVLHRRIAETVRDRFADEAAAAPEVLAHHFTQAGMTDQAVEWWGKAGDQALRRSAFQEAISHLGKAIEMADRERGAAQRAAVVPSQRVKLQTTYGQALSWAKGYAAPETAAAFARARDLAAVNNNPAEKFASIYGQWSVDILRAELASARQLAEILLADAEKAMIRPEIAVGRRITALTRFLQGAFEEARINAEEALKIYNPEWDPEVKFRTNHDTGATATAYLALTSWVFGNASEAQTLADQARSRSLACNHVPTAATTGFFIVLFDAISGRAERTRTDATALIQTTREHATPTFLALATIFQGWAAAHLGEHDTGRANLSEGLANYTRQGNRTFLPLIWGLLADIEAAGRGAEAALIRVDEALALAAETGERWTDSILYRIRGEILLKCDSTNTAPAENAFLTAIAIAQQQNAKSLELQATLPLAKLYQSTGHPAEAHAVLAPALEGFSPNPEFPEIQAAQSFLNALAENEAVKNAIASNERRLKLQTSYSRAVMWARGFGAAEAKAAFTRAEELAKGIKNPTERFEAYYGIWAGRLLHGEVGLALQTGETFLRDAQNGAWPTELSVARRILGLVCLSQGDFVQARAHLEEALKIFDPECDRDAEFRFGQDSRVGAMIYLAHTEWLLGQVGRARKLMDDAVARAVETGHVPTQSTAYYYEALLETFSGNGSGAERAAKSLVEVSQEHGLPLFLAWGTLSLSWARARLGETAVTEFAQAIAAYTTQGNKFHVPFFQGLLAEMDDCAKGADEALTRVDEALALAAETGECWSDAFLHCIRGQILLKGDPANIGPAEQAFLTAIAVAQQQRARSFELRAAVSLAKLYQSAGRAADAHAIVAPALEGFSQTLEFPEIAEAQALLATLQDVAIH